MPYIDSNYYNQTYKGVPIADQQQLERLILRASEDIDRFTCFRIINLESMHPKIKEQVKKAVAAQVEHLFKKETGQAAESYDVTIGKFKYSSGSGKDSAAAGEFASNICFLLLPTGLLYAGIGQGGHS